MSTPEVYQATQSADSLKATSKRPVINSPARETHRVAPQGSTPEDRGLAARDKIAKAPHVNSVVGAPVSLYPSAIIPAVDKPLPVRTPPQVMRGWIAPWEDIHRVLHVGGYVFVEIEERRWTFGENALSTEPVRFFSLQSATVEQAKKSGGEASSPQSPRTSVSATSHASATPVFNTPVVNTPR